MSASDSVCEICLEKVEQPVDTECHKGKLCQLCWKQYLNVAVQEMSYKAGSPISCPVCVKKTIPVQFVMASVDADQASLLGSKMLEVYVRQANDVQRCPLSRCKFAYLPQSCNYFSRKEVECPVCFTSLSKGFSLSLTPLITFIYMTFMTNNCPKCQIPIDRVSGCFHMTCSCGHQFCWYCLKNYHMVANSQYRQHNHKDCIFLLLMKILTVILCFFSLIVVLAGAQSFNHIMCSIGQGILFLFRLLLTDGAIACQFIVLMRHNQVNYNRQKAFKKILLCFLVADLAAVGVLLYLGQLLFTTYLICISLGIGLIGASIVLLVQFSWSTWMYYIQ